MRDLLNSVIEKNKSRFKYKELPKFPSVIRDISFTVPSDVKAGNIEMVLKSSKNKLLKDFRVFDYYTSNNFKSFTYTLKFYDDEKTLNDEEVNRSLKELLILLNEKVGAELRK